MILARGDRAALASMEALLAHEARHATQYAWCGGVVMLPLYFLAAGVSWGLTGDFGARNVFERQAGLADGGYTDKPLRPCWPGSPGPAASRGNARHNQAAAGSTTPGPSADGGVPLC